MRFLPAGSKPGVSTMKRDISLSENGIDPVEATVPQSR
jgi:hypothetical protein